MKKSELLNWLQEEYQQWEALLDQIGPTRMDQPGVNGDWSMKDIVAHLTGWQPQTCRPLTGCTTRRTRTASTLASAPAN